MAKPSCQSTSHRLPCQLWNVKTANRDVQGDAGAVVSALPGNSSTVLQNDCLKVSMMVTDLQMPIPWWDKACCFISLISLTLLKNRAQVEIERFYHSVSRHSVFLVLGISLLVSWIKNKGTRFGISSDVGSETAEKEEYNYFLGIKDMIPLFSVSTKTVS